MRYDGPGGGRAAPDGPFEYYQDNPESTDSAGGQSITQAESFNALQQNIDSRKDAAVREVNGNIYDTVQNPSKRSRADAVSLRRNSILVGGALRMYAAAVRTYNNHIDDLNAKYAAAKARDFDFDPKEAGLAQGPAYQRAVNEAGSAYKAKLEKKRQRYEAELDEQADHVALMLKHGPTSKNLLWLGATGYITVEQTTRETEYSPQFVMSLRGIYNDVTGAAALPDNVRTLRAYLLGLKPQAVMMNRKEVKAQARAVVKASSGRADAISRWIRMQRARTKGGMSAEEASKILRGKAVLIGTGKSSKLAKVLAALDIANGAYSFYATVRDREMLTTRQEVLGYASSSLSVLGGTTGLLARVPTPASPVLAAISIGAGVAALGTSAWSYTDGGPFTHLDGLVDDTGEPSEPDPEPGPKPTPGDNEGDEPEPSDDETTPRPKPTPQP